MSSFVRLLSSISRRKGMFSFLAGTKVLKSPALLFSSEQILYNAPKTRNETEDVKRARLVYQSRKRGTLENGLILSSFADRYLHGMNATFLSQFDELINLPENDWDIYYWALGTRPVPERFNNEVMALLQDFVRNKYKENYTR